MKNKLKYAGPPALKKTSHSKTLKKNSNNVGPTSLHKASDPMNLKKESSNAGELLHLKSSSPSDRYQATQKGKSKSTNVEHKQYREMNNLQSAKKAPVDSEVVDYPINLTGKGYLKW